MTEDLDREVRLHVYRFFVAEGHPPVAADVAARLGLPVHEAEASIRRLADSRILVLAPGTPYIWMANPLSALPSPYRVHTAGRDWWGICIWDAMGIVAMLGDDQGTITSRCPDCGDEMLVEIEGEPQTPPEWVVHYAVPAAHWWDDIGFN